MLLEQAHSNQLLDCLVSIATGEIFQLSSFSDPFDIIAYSIAILLTELLMVILLADLLNPEASFASILFYKLEINGSDDIVLG
jgi:hypothetical protein